MSTLEEIDAKLEAIRKDPKYIALKNKQRKTPQDMEKFNAFIRQMGRLDAQRTERVAENKRNNVESAPYITAKPVWRNQPAAVAKQNQDAGKVAHNWVPENAVPLADAHPEALKLNKAANVVEPEPTPTGPSGGRLMVHKLFRRKVLRTPNELKKMQERSANIKTPKGAPEQPRTKATHRVNEEPEVLNLKPTTRRTAPPVVHKEQVDVNSDGNASDELDDVSEENHDNVYEGDLIDDLDEELDN